MPAIKTTSGKRRSTVMTPQRALASAIASQRIEGLELDARASEEFRALATGKLSTTELRQRLLVRYTKRATSD